MAAQLGLDAAVQAERSGKGQQAAKQLREFGRTLPGELDRIEQMASERLARLEQN
jgi:hypothetical protein